MFTTNQAIGRAIGFRFVGVCKLDSVAIVLALASFTALLSSKLDGWGYSCFVLTCYDEKKQLIATNFLSSNNMSVLEK